MWCLLGAALTALCDIGLNWYLLWMGACWLLQSCPAPWDPVDCSPPGSSVHGVLQARALEWVAVPSSRGSSPPRDRTRVSCVSCVEADSWCSEPPGKPVLGERPEFVDIQFPVEHICDYVCTHFVSDEHFLVFNDSCRRKPLSVECGSTGGWSLRATNYSGCRGTIYEWVRESCNTLYIEQVTLKSPQAQKFPLHTFREP